MFTVSACVAMAPLASLHEKDETLAEFLKDGHTTSATIASGHLPEGVLGASHLQYYACIIVLLIIFLCFRTSSSGSIEKGGNT